MWRLNLSNCLLGTLTMLIEYRRSFCDSSFVSVKVSRSISASLCAVSLTLWILLDVEKALRENCEKLSWLKRETIESYKIIIQGYRSVVSYVQSCTRRFGLPVEAIFTGLLTEKYHSWRDFTDSITGRQAEIRLVKRMWKPLFDDWKFFLFFKFNWSRCETVLWA